VAQLRPDLAWVGIIGPEHGNPGGIIGPERVGIIGPERATMHTPVHIAGRFVERNGDVGAKAECVLAVDGVEVERSQPMFVAAGGTAMCSFTRQFDSLGVKSVSITLTNVVPADYDNANNVIVDTVTIIGPERGRV
jgi:hypothetical protein